MSTKVFGAVSPVPTGFQPRGMTLPAWRPAQVLARPIPPSRLGQEAAAKAIGIGVIALPTALAAATAYVGFRLGSKDQGFPMILGYIVGLAGGIAAFWGLLAMIGVATVPMAPGRFEPPVA